MPADLSPLITQQRQRFDELRTDAQDISAAIADETWDRFEVEVEKTTENGLDLSFTGMIGTSLSVALVDAYEKAFEHFVLARCERMNVSLAQTPGPVAIDIARIDLIGLRKGIKLRRAAQALIDQAIESAKPGIGRVLSVVVGGIFRDPIQELEDIEKNMQDDAHRLRHELLALREPLRARAAEESLSAIQSVRLEMARQFDLWASRVLASTAADPS